MHDGSPSPEELDKLSIGASVPAPAAARSVAVPAARTPVFSGMQPGTPNLQPLGAAPATPPHWTGGSSTPLPAPGTPRNGWTDGSGTPACDGRGNAAPGTPTGWMPPEPATAAVGSTMYGIGPAVVHFVQHFGPFGPLGPPVPLQAAAPAAVPAHAAPEQVSPPPTMQTPTMQGPTVQVPTMQAPTVQAPTMQAPTERAPAEQAPQQARPTSRPSCRPQPVQPAPKPVPKPLPRRKDCEAPPGDLCTDLTPISFSLFVGEGAGRFGLAPCAIQEWPFLNRRIPGRRRHAGIPTIHLLIGGLARHAVVVRLNMV